MKKHKRDFRIGNPFVLQRTASSRHSVADDNLHGAALEVARINR